MSDVSDLMIAAAAAAAVVTWMELRTFDRSRGTGGTLDWRALLREAKSDFGRAWHETPGWLFITGIREAFFFRKQRRSAAKLARRMRV